MNFELKILSKTKRICRLMPKISQIQWEGDEVDIPDEISVLGDQRGAILRLQGKNLQPSLLQGLRARTVVQANEEDDVKDMLGWCKA